MSRNTNLYQDICAFFITLCLIVIGVASCEPAYAADIVREKSYSSTPGMTKVIVITEQCDDVQTEERAEEQSQKRYLGSFTVTHYCPYGCCNGKWAGKTASGAIPMPWHTIAVDEKVIPMGSKVHIERYGDFVAEDCGGAIKGNRIDVLVGSHSEAISLGVKRMEVYLI